jgi:glucose-6-phosphate 1-dehydrogenase
MKTNTLTPALHQKMGGHWHAANCLPIGQRNWDPTFFMRVDQIEAAWQILTPMQGVSTGSHPRTFPNYVADSSGSKMADELLALKGHACRPNA